MGLFGWLSDQFETQNKFQAQNPFSTADQQRQYLLGQELYQKQQDLGNMLLQQAQGNGPSPVGQMLQNALGQNQANAASFAASQRGMNPALAARLASNQMAKMGQQTAGQSAILKAQEQQQAQGMLGNLYGGMGGFLLSQQQNINSANDSANRINYNVSSGNQAAQNQMTGAIINGIAPATSLMKGLGGAGASGGAGNLAGAGEGGSMATSGMMYSAHGGEVPEHFHSIASIYHPHKAMNFKRGGGVPGKAIVPGDSPKNDTVPAMLSPGEIVLPKSVTESSHPAAKASTFVKHLAAKKGKKNEA